MSSLISQIYSADDLYIMELRNQASRSLGNKPAPLPLPENDAFVSQTRKAQVKDYAKKGLTIGAIGAGIWGAIKLASKFFTKVK